MQTQIQLYLNPSFLLRGPINFFHSSHLKPLQFDVVIQGLVVIQVKDVRLRSTLKQLRVGMFLIWHYQMFFCYFSFWVLWSLYMLKCYPRYHHTCMFALHTHGVFFVCTFNLLCTSYTDFATFVEMSHCYIQKLCISASKGTSSSFCKTFIRFHVQTFKHDTLKLLNA